MQTKKILLGGIAATIALFFLGWVIYGMLLTDFILTNYDQSLMKAEEDMIWWAMIVSNLAGGYLLAFILSWSNAKTHVEGAKIGGITGLLMALSINLSFFSMSDMLLSLTPVIVDTIVVTLLWALVGIAVVWIMGMVGKKA